ncbi:hypothetical protein V6N12_008646 [Hibiscus sabdariffa]|uniref:RNase H type-1 domain-containing protein n=1 Tax=Hibiscus sabdariffa TaxID=183260 RepID=A0ABR2BJM9_9ROSI
MGSTVRRGSSTLLAFLMDLLDRPWEVRLEHVRRSGNALADRMAKKASGNDLIVCRFLDPLRFAGMCCCVSRLLELNHGGTVGCFGSLLV